MCIPSGCCCTCLCLLQWGSSFPCKVHRFTISFAQTNTQEREREREREREVCVPVSYELRREEIEMPSLDSHEDR